MMKTTKGMKKEARIARVEGLPAGGVLIIIFRGGWIDGLAGLMAGGRPEPVIGWLGGSKYWEELKGISLGENLEASIGAGGSSRVREWAKSKGLPEVGIGARNRRQARVLAEGFLSLLEGKG